MTLYRNENRWDTSNVVFHEGRIVQYDKRDQTPEMHHIDYGLGVMRAQVLVDWDVNETFDLGSVYESLVSRGELAGYEVSERFYEIGSPAGLNETSALLEAIRREEETTPIERLSEFRGRGA
jgi:NDP-sugar pyrophosphorylase family protein